MMIVLGWRASSKPKSQEVDDFRMKKWKPKAKSLINTNQKAGWKPEVLSSGNQKSSRKPYFFSLFFGFLENIHFFSFIWLNLPVLKSSPTLVLITNHVFILHSRFSLVIIVKSYCPHRGGCWPNRKLKAGSRKAKKLRSKSESETESEILEI